MNVENLPQDQELLQLVKLLEKAGIPYQRWSQGRKDVPDLLAEIRAGETELLPDPTYGLVRQLLVLKVVVNYTDAAGQKWTLKEDKQVWHHKFNPDHTQRVDRRDYLPLGISEKIGRSELKANNEVKPAGIARALQEELGIRETLPAVFKGIRHDFSDSPSYPGLKSKYIEYVYHVALPSKLYQPQFIESGEEKDTYFTWVKAPKA